MQHLDASGRALSANAIKSSVTYLMDMSGVRIGPRSGRSPHVLCHSAATTRMEESGGNISAVQELLNHESVATTEDYVRRAQSQLGDQLNAISSRA